MKKIEGRFFSKQSIAAEDWVCRIYNSYLEGTKGNVVARSS